jgi:hypothetical protein
VDGQGQVLCQPYSATIDKAGAEVSIGRCVLILIVARQNCPRFFGGCLTFPFKDWAEAGGEIDKPIEPGM